MKHKVTSDAIGTLTRTLRRPNFLAAALALLLTAGAVGCTLYPDKNPPTLATTTSAEQHERILWQMVEKQQWSRIAPLFSTTLVWNVNGRSLSASEVVSYLQSLQLKDAVVSGAAVRPNGADMTVTYTLQISGADGAPREFSVFSVWQRMKGGSYVLIAHSQQAASPTSTAATIR